MIKRNELVPHAGERNPRILDMNAQLDALKKQILQSVENYLAGLQVQLSGFQTQESRVTQSIASNPGQEKLLTSIEREHQLKQALYLHLLQKREENDMTLMIANTNTRIISPPFGSPHPVKPNRYSIYLVALFLGVSIPGGLAVGKEFVTSAIRDKNELDVLPVPLLGIIPKAKNREKNKMLLVQEHGEGQMNEAFRFLRTGLMGVCSSDTKVIQVTSMDPGSGKTFLALNLAMSFAVAGKRVALFDLDMRKATLSRLIGNPEFGIFHLLANMVQHERYFIEKEYFYPGFDILPTGPLPLSPSELLMSENLKKIIQRYKDSYDYIFIDSPPVDLVTDADIIAQLADSSIFVLRENYTTRRKLPEIENIYRKERFKNMRLVLNGSIAKDQLDHYYDDYDKEINVLPPQAHTHAVIPKARYLT
jgi:capsular exopolysaccharide synthesis family protein